MLTFGAAALVVAFYGVLFYAVYRYFRELQGMRRALERIAERDA